MKIINKMRKKNENETSSKARSLICLLVITTVIQQFFIKEVEIYNLIRMFLFIGFPILFLFLGSRLFNFKIDGFIKVYISCLFVATVNILFFLLINNNLNYFSIIELAIPLGVLLCSYFIQCSERLFIKLCYVYVITATLLCLYIIFFYGEGFIITEAYFFSSKNQIGPIMGISIIILVWMIFTKFGDGNNGNRYIQTIIKLVTLTIIISSLLVIRNRSGLIACIIIISLMLLKNIKNKVNKKNISIIIFGIVLLMIMGKAGAFESVENIIWKSFTLNYNTSDLNSLSAGRTEVYSEVVNFVTQHPLFGKVAAVYSSTDKPHNYVLYKVLDYGIFGAAPFIALYVYLWIYALKKTIFGNCDFKKNLFNLGPWLLLFSLITSIFEYTHPFGPGTTQTMLWFSVGQYLHSNAAQNELK